jgi:hypothetical protein
MYEEYKEQNKSDVADIKNSGGRWGGAITAAQFLAEFSQDTPWTHLDIAGTSYTTKEKAYLIKLPPYIHPPYLVHYRLIDQYGYISFSGNYYWVPDTPGLSVYSGNK